MNICASIDRFREKYKRQERLRSDLTGPGAQIYQCIDKATKEVRSMKVIKKSKCTYLEFLREVNILKECKGHPNLIDVQNVYECHRFYYIVMDNLDHPTLYQTVTSQNRPIEVGTFLKTLLNILVFLHDPNNHSKKEHKAIYHGNIHPKNILVPEGLNPDGKSLEHLLLVDFSYATMELDVDESNFASENLLEECDTSDSDSSDDDSSASASERDNDDDYTQQTKSTKRKKRKGGSRFQPPEYSKTGPSAAGDIWSLGVLAFHLLTGCFPFAKPADTREDIKDWRGQEDEEIKRFIQSLLAFNPKERPTALEINRSNFWSETNLQQHEEDFKDIMSRLANVNKEQEFKVAVRSYIASNFLHESDLERLGQVFRLVDFSNNNTLSKAEFQRAMLEHDFDVSLEAIDSFFEQLDVSGDKRISYVEYLAFAEKEERLFDRENLKAAFDAFDWSKTGYITEDDLINFAGSASGASAFRDEKMMKRSTICKMIEQADKNGDSKISFEEFADLMLSTKEYDEQTEKKAKRKEYYAKMLKKKKKSRS